MESKQKITAYVKSPAKDAHIREGKGFSLSEIREAGKRIESLRTLKINIDYFRKSTHPENVEKLKSIKETDKKRKKKRTFIKKEKKRTAFKPKTEEPTVTIEEVKEETLVKKGVKAKKKPVKKEKPKVAKIEKEEKTGIPLIDLKGLGATTAKKFADLGVNTVEDLCKEKPEELAPLIKGVSVEKLKKYIEEGKELLK